MADSIDIRFLKQAIEISKQTPPSEARFSVGAVLVDRNRNFVASGFTNELGDGWHAEAVAIKKAADNGFVPKGASIYSTMEPCSIRVSGKENCATLLIEKEILRVVFALSEPPIFVVGEGESKLKQAGIKVEQIISLEKSVIEINKHLLSKQARQKKTKLVKSSILLMVICSIFNPALASDPIGNANLGSQPKTQNTDPIIESHLKAQQPGPIADFYTNLLKKFGGFDKNDLQARHLIDSKGGINEQQLSTEIKNLPIKDEQVKKGLTLVKSLIYNPSNPGPFFDNLIALQSISVAAQAQLVSISEKTLGPQNSYVIGLKDNYSRTVKYVEALKMQKVILEQTTPKLHK